MQYLKLTVTQSVKYTHILIKIIYMKLLSYIVLFFMAAVMLSCEKNDGLEENPGLEESELVKRSEAHLQLKSTESIYTDQSGNKYYSFNFNPDTLEHVYSVFFEEGKKYYLTLAGENAYPVEIYLISATNDTLFYGEPVYIPIMKKYIVWESTISDTLYIAVAYTEDINFHTYYYQLTFEELSIKRLTLNDLTLECSGDWFIGEHNQLTLACHNTNYTKWARIVDNTLFNYEFSYEVGLKSGIPDIYTGIAFYAVDELQEMFNIPAACYEFKIVGPSSWEVWTWNNGVGRYTGYTEISLNRGEGAFNKLSLTASNDSAICYVNSEQVDAFRNNSFMDNGLYITVSDEKDDTLYFDNIHLIK